MLTWSLVGWVITFLFILVSRTCFKALVEEFGSSKLKSGNWTRHCRILSAATSRPWLASRIWWEIERRWGSQTRFAACPSTPSHSRQLPSNVAWTLHIWCRSLLTIGWWSTPHWHRPAMIYTWARESRLESICNMKKFELKSWNLNQTKLRWVDIYLLLRKWPEKIITEPRKGPAIPVATVADGETADKKWP